MQTTANYGLKKPDGTDIVNIQDFNDNVDVIDQKLKQAMDAAGEIGSHADTHRPGGSDPIPTAAPSGGLGTANAAGSSTSLARADHAHLAFDSTNPVANGTASAGSAATAARRDHVHPTDTTRAPLASPALTGTPTAPTAAADTSTTQIATTAFVTGQAGTVTPNMDGSAAVGTSKKYAREDHRHPADTTRAPLASPALTGTPTAPTAAVDTSTTQVATTAFVVNQAASTSPVMDGTATAGTSKRYARADHVHPVDTSRAAQTDLVAHLAEDATLTTKGHVQLSSSTTSTSTTLAATPSAVKVAMDKANAAIPSSQKGVANGIADLDSSGNVPANRLGNAAKFQRGSLSGFSKSMAPLEEYTVTIPVMPEAQSGRVYLSGSNYIGMEIAFNRSSLDGYSITGAGANSCASSKMDSGYVSYYGYGFNGSSTVKILECYINSNNSIIIKFVNTHLSTTTTINVASMSWEVKSQ
ncbi:tail fiber protein [Desulfosporosinus youngiae]|uniref:Phage-related tail fiber protein n=1 Tax=Desulfosporosinus youngiae DSM 17734 TaxID=768710 RepID=H5XZS8_9FIRM|nr:tail fiber protein [Desulfosporosinus youngiae]EHQ92124.1 phage-related tail fiber protein [Desulfosporosinus youngiae DSM 17734]